MTVVDAVFSHVDVAPDVVHVHSYILHNVPRMARWGNRAVLEILTLYKADNAGNRC